MDKRNTIAAAITAHLCAVGRATRGELIGAALAALGLPASVENPGAGSTYARTHSYISAVLLELADRGAVEVDEGGYTLAEEALVTVEEMACERELLRLLNTGTYTKDRLYAALCRSFGTDKTFSLKDDRRLRSMAGGLLVRLQRGGTVQFTDGKYRVAHPIPRDPMPEEEFRRAFHTRLCSLGGAFFEKFLCNLLEKYYLITGRTVLSCGVVGGSEDGGIDVALTTVDGLGFRERVLVQAKCRERSHVTEKEVREFYGAMHAGDGTRGIYATTSVFHEGATKLLASIDNLVGLDGEGLFRMVKQTGYGILRSRGGLCFDPAVFDM